MGYKYDAEVEANLKMMKQVLGSIGISANLPVGDVESRRAMFQKLVQMPGPKATFPENIQIQDFYTSASDGHQILLRWISEDRSPSSGPSPAVFHIHGGGMILGSVDLSTSSLAAQVSATSVPILSVEYRLAPENQHPIPVEDCYAGLCWLQSHAKELSVDVSRVAILGESSGAGLAAATALMARDKKLNPPLAKQFLWAPMLDDRNTVPDKNLEPFVFWTYDDNKTGWGALLGSKQGGDDVDYYGSPARATDLSGLPDTYLDVGQLDIFVNDTMDYARKLSQGGVNVELHMYPGCCHTFDKIAKDGKITKRAQDNRLTAIRSL